MIPSNFKKGASGRIIAHPRGYHTFVPHPLPPAISLDPLASLIEEASHAVGNLKGAGHRLPNPHMFVRPFIRREAVLSSKIEGTQTSFSDLLFFEAAPTATAPDDAPEVLNYIHAVEFGMERLKHLPLSLRLCRELHEKLMAGTRGEHAEPGEFRKRQNWIGAPGSTLSEAAYVPPPVDEMRLALGDWEKHLHAKVGSTLVQAAQLHYQFEAIHPFIDGNGRLGRLLITLFLADRKLLPQPLLYLSAFFERHRSAYYEHLMAVSTSGRWVEWIEFFLRGVRTQANEAVQRIERLLDLEKKYRALVLGKGKAAGSLVKLIDALFFHTPVLTVRQAQEILGSTFASGQKNIDRLIDLGILREVSGNSRNRVYFAREIYALALEDLPEAPPTKSSDLLARRGRRWAYRELKDPPTVDHKKLDTCADCKTRSGALLFSAPRIRSRRGRLFRFRHVVGEGVQRHSERFDCGPQRVRFSALNRSERGDDGCHVQFRRNAELPYFLGHARPDSNGRPPA